MTRGKITKKELRTELKGNLVAVGFFLMYFSMREKIMETFPAWVQITIGGAIVYFALKKW